MSDAYDAGCNTIEELFQNIYGGKIKNLIGARPIVVKNQYEKERYDIYISPEQESYVVDTTNKAWKHVANFSIVQLPGCCGVAVFHHCSVEKEFQNKGLGALLHKLRLDMAKQMKYGMAVCTTLDSNIIEEKILKANNWIQDGTFINPKTKNRVHHWYKRLENV